MSSGASDDRGAAGTGSHEFWDDPADPAGAEGARFGSFRGAEDSGSMPLPHWTEPPSGEVPRILPDGDDGPPADDDLRAWSSLSTGPRWRDQHTDWDDADFGEEMLDDPEMRVGALHPDADVENEAEFAFPEPAPRRSPAPRAAPARAGSVPGPAPATVSSTTGRRPRPGAGEGGAAGGARGRRSASGSLPVQTGGRPPGGPAQPRDLTTSVVTGVVAFAVVLVAAKIGPAALLVLVTAALVIAAGELFQGMRTRGLHPATLLAVVGTAAMSGAVYWRGVDGFHMVLPLFLVFTLLWYLLGISHGQPLVNASVSLFGFLYVGGLGSFAALLLTYPRDHGIGLLLGAVITTAAYDAGAYLFGRSFGRTPLMPDISPGKTVEGMVGACVVTLIAGAVVGQIAPWSTKHGIVLAVVVMVVAPLGDLCESMLKRDLGVKDMGSILPGHGGVLDRIDALLFVVPATYYLARVLDIF